MSSNNCKEEDDGNESSPLFLVNKTGFPISNQVWNRMFDFSTKLNEEMKKEIEKLQSSKEAKDMPIPIAPLNMPSSIPVYQKVDLVQNYMRKLQYNHTGTQFYDIRKYRPLNGLNDLAREMIRESLPIKCLEAVVLGINLTNGVNGLERFTIGLKSEFDGTVHRHVVLGLFYGGYFGAIGMSRREDLMYKPMSFNNLSDMIFDFKKCYEKYWHQLKRIKIGFPINHDAHSYEGIPWKGLIITFGKEKDHEIRNNIDKFSRKIKAYAGNVSNAMQQNLPVIKREFCKASKKTSNEGNGLQKKVNYQIRI